MVNRAPLASGILHVDGLGRVIEFIPCIPSTTYNVRIGLLGNSNGLGVEATASSGAASSLPSTPAAYLSIAINGTKYKLPLYNI